MKFIKLLTAVGAALACVCTTANAQTTAPINIVTTAVPFLRISPDARTGGMGDVGIATSPDANSGFSNLSKDTICCQQHAGIGNLYALAERHCFRCLFSNA